MCHLDKEGEEPLSDLLGSAGRFGVDFVHIVGDEGPFFFAILVDEGDDYLVFLGEGKGTSGVQSLRSIDYL